ncbi:PucR family transcriptional regulator [Salisediminibacterium selenitireducens]|uniref:Transcriptional regulator, CdaR n=1 Tax=Bacillus selenitireducens (strain ATCC 700615 / DSM 15326 / MLS10) TaxID=439292 RepID=D6XVT2_BACIE|nr:PucR family transcriptional regulator [Salisediminibacterium selenitireducens]ADH97705.1 transcriptional regulator, CdaR [[Bacillus] selenitireducens MLS10]
MEMTLADIQKLPAFEGVKLIAGHEGIDRVIRNVYFMEVPDIFGYIDEGGFLLSTLYPIADDEAAIQRLIPGLVEVGMAGLAIKPARYITDVPDVMIEQANELGFPLFVLGQGANLSTLTNTILETLLDKNTSTLQFRNDLHNKMMEELVNGASLTELTMTVSEMIESPIILLDRELERITDTTGKRVKVDRESVPPLPVERSFCLPNHVLDQVRLSVGSDGEIFLKDSFIQPVLAGEECFGYMILPTTDRQIDPNAKMALEQTSLLMASVFQRDKALKQKEENYLDAFIRDVLNEKMGSQFEVIEKAKLFKWDLQFPVALFNMSVRLEDVVKKRRILIQYMENRVVEQFLSRKLDIHISKIKLIYMDDSICAFINVAFESGIDERLIGVCEELVAYLESHDPDAPLSIGIADTVEGLGRFSKAYHEAIRTRELSEKIAEGGSFVRHYRDMVLYELIDQISEDVRADFIDKRIGAVLRYDETKKMELLKTLEAFIDHDFNAQKAAASLFIHYNTFRYRLEKLKELGVDYDSGFDWMETALACRMQKLL